MHPDLGSRQQARELLERTRAAFELYRSYDQARVDRICYAMVEAGYRESRRLAELAVAETGFGRVESKEAKNRFATRGLWRYIRELKTCGLIASDPRRGVDDYADPFGVIAAIIPTTNPTSTALFKAIIAMKSRNGMVTSPHPRAVRCIAESIRVVHEAAVEAGAPRDILTVMDEVTLEGTDELMKHRLTDLILATGGAGLVRAAYSSGKPAFGVGPGNSPAWIDRSADLAAAARAIVASQTFDNGTICASEQSLVLDRPIRDAFLAEMKKLGAHHCSAEEARKLAGIVVRGRSMNAEIVGRYPHELARMAGFELPQETTVLLADCAGVGWEHPLSVEKLSPILSVFTEDGHDAGCRRCLEVLAFGGMGHTLAIHCRDEAVIREFAEKKPVNRILVNSPSSQGAVGYTTGLVPSMTLGCGSFGGNITSDNIGPMHLLNVKRLARVDGRWDTPDWRDDFPDLGPAPTAATAPESRAVAPAAPQGPAPTRGRKPLWVPRPSQQPETRCAVSGLRPEQVYSASDLEQIIRSALANKRTDGCPFGRCADCPPERGGVCPGC